MMPVQKCRGSQSANLTKSESSGRFGQYGCGWKERLKLLYEKIARRCVKLIGGNFNVRAHALVSCQSDHCKGRATVMECSKVQA
jgi:hypothetical protein